MNGVTLMHEGDEREQEFWPALQQHFPLYEEFWRLRIFPLRGADGFIRGDIDERVEIMAQEHYKCFISLKKALDRLADEAQPKPFGDFCRNIARYRNHIHEDVMGMVERRKRRYLPNPDKLDQYKRWSRLRRANLADFMPVSALLRERFEYLCKLLDQHWRMMLDRSQEVLASPRYAQLVPPQPQTSFVMSRVVLSSNIQLG